MSKEKLELAIKYDQAPGDSFQKAFRLIRDYSCIDGYLLSARTSRVFSFDTRVSAPYADNIAKRIDHFGLGSRIISTGGVLDIKNVPDLLSCIIRRVIYEALIEGDRLKAIVDVILEKNNLTAQYVFIDLAEQRKGFVDNADRLMRMMAAERKRKQDSTEPTPEMIAKELKELEVLETTHANLISCCAKFKRELVNIKNARASEMNAFIEQLERKLLPNVNGLKLELARTEDLQRQINNFSSALRNNVHKFNRLKDPESERFIQQVLAILGTVLASIPTLGIVAGCMAAYGHFAKKDSLYFWNRTPTKVEEFKKEVDLQLTKCGKK